MAFTRLHSIVTFLTFALFTFAAPSDLDTRATTPKPVQFTINLKWGDIAPAGGATRKAILTNGTIPGPPLRLTVGDNVEFMVHNNLPNKTTIHFHGIEMKNTPWSDGVPGLSQAPIAPGKSFLYKWTANEPGVYFYHAHYKSQIMDGLYGAIIIQPQPAAPRPFYLISNDTADRTAMRAAEQNMKPVFISDWSHFTSAEFYDIQQTANIDYACTDSILINGHGSVYCLSADELLAYTNPKIPSLLAGSASTGLTNKGCLPPDAPAIQGNYVRNLTAIPPEAYYVCTPSTGSQTYVNVDPAAKWAALTFINTGGFETLRFSIDSHKMYVYAVDGRYIQPQLVDTIMANNGDRYSVMIKLDQAVGQYAIRVANGGLNQVISGFATLNYKGAVGPSSTATSVMNYAGVNTTLTVPFVDALAVPFPAVPVSQTADRTYIFDIEKLGAGFGAYQWTLSGVDAYSMAEEDATPLLFEKPKNVPATDIVLKTSMGMWIDLIVKVSGPLAEPHPMHKHSNKAFVLGQGVGSFNYTNVADAAAAMPAGTFNLANPPYRDGFVTTPAEGNSSWLALRYHVENAGAFLFHCHVQTHLAGGMAVAMMDGVDNWPVVPAAYANGGNGIVKTKGN